MHSQRTGLAGERFCKRVPEYLARQHAEQQIYINAVLSRRDQNFHNVMLRARAVVNSRLAAAQHQQE